MDLFTAVKELAGFAMNQARDREFRTLLKEILEGEEDLKVMLSKLAELVSGLRNDIIWSTARGYFNSARRSVADSDLLLVPEPLEVKFELCKEAHKEVNRGLGFLEGAPSDREVFCGLYLVGASLKMYILRKERELGLDTTALIRENGQELSERASAFIASAERRWDSRRKIVTRVPPSGVVAGGYDLVVDGRIVGGTSGPFDDDSDLVVDLMMQRRAEIYPTLHPMYAAAIELLRQSGNLRLFKRDDCALILWVTGRGESEVYHSVDNFTLFDSGKWFQRSDLKIDNGKFIRPFGASVTDDIAPGIAVERSWSHRQQERYGEFPYWFFATTSEGGRLLETDQSSHIFWLSRAEMLHWVTSPAVVNSWFPGMPVEKVDVSTIGRYILGPNIDTMNPTGVTVNQVTRAVAREKGSKYMNLRLDKKD